MRLIEMAEYVCGKVNQSDVEDLAACKLFLLRRRDMVWGAQLWKDAVMEVRVGLTSTGILNVEGQVADTDTAQWIPSRGHFVCPAFVERVLAARVTEGKLDVTNAQTYFRSDFDSFAQTGVAREFYKLSPCVYEYGDYTTVTALLELAADSPTELIVEYLYLDGVRLVRETISVNRSDIAQELFGTYRIDKVTKPATTGIIEFGGFTDLPLAAYSMPRRQRIRLVAIPTASTTLRLMVKRLAPTFTDDNDEPGLTGVENCLLAFAQNDMLQRERQYAKAQGLQQEAIALLADLVAQETVQESYTARIVPECGYGDDYGLLGGCGGF